MNGYDKLIKIIRQEGKRGMTGSPFYLGTVIEDGVEIAGVTFERTDLLFADHLADHEDEVQMNWETDSASLHAHPITGTKKLSIKSPLKTGDTVLCIRIDDAFIVAERLV